MHTLHFTLRAGTAPEIETLCEIDLDACELFTQAGLDLDLPAGHQFFVAERARWMRSLDSGRAIVAIGGSDRMLGFAAGALIDGEAYLDQLSVRREFMRQGVGRALLRDTGRRAREEGSSALWLTTYDHLSWNRPFYERVGFSVMPESEWGPQMRAVIAHERRWLPLPERRVVMRMPLNGEFCRAD